MEPSVGEAEEGGLVGFLWDTKEADTGSVPSPELTSNLLMLDSRSASQNGVVPKGSPCLTHKGLRWGAWVCLTQRN